MYAALSLARVDAPERGGSDAPEGDEATTTGDRQPAPPTILVVEDEVLVRLAVTDYLRHCGYRVLEAKTAEEAQAILAAAGRVDILFSDINLGPGLNGFELATWTRQHYSGLRIILTSGVAKMTQSARDLCDGPLLNKPYVYETLAGHIERLLGKRGSA